MRINIQTIPAVRQRYPTIGDYWTAGDGGEEIRVTEMDDWRYEFLVVVHELIESYLCKHRGIAEPDIKAFDEMFETEHHDDRDEPGFDSRAPYRREHHFATGIEMLLAKELDVDWREYERYLEGK